MKIQSPWMGRIRGSAGNMTGCKVYDKNVMRAKAFEVNNPNTAAQQVQRGYFAELTKLVAGFTSNELRTLFPSKPKAMSRRNALSKQLAEYNTIEGSEKVIDFAEIDTLGNAPTANLILTNESFEGDSYFVEWNPMNFGNESNKNLQVVLVLVNASKKEFSFPDLLIPISIGYMNCPIPTTWEENDNVHAIPFITNTENDLLQYGSFIIKVRPEKKSN